MRKKLSALCWATIAEAHAKGVSIPEMWKYYMEYKLGPSVPVGEAVDELVLTKEQTGKSKGYVDELRRVLLNFAETVGGCKPVKEITLDEVTSWVMAVSLNTAKTRRSKLSTLMRFCKRRYYCKEVLVDRMESISAVIDEPRILNNDDLRKLLTVTADVDPGMLGYIWLAGALGIRHAEILKLKPSNLLWSSDSVEISARIAKCRSRRLAGMVCNPFERRGKRAVLNFQNNFRRRFDVIKQVASMSTWSRNCLRHTAATHLLNLWKDEGRVSLHLGNSPKVIHRHYRGLASPKETEEFWAIWEAAKLK